MLAIIYLALAAFVGYHFIKKFLPGLFNISNTKSLFGKPFKLSSWMITLPAAFLTGTLGITWMTYLVSWCVGILFPVIKKPLLIGDIVIYIVFITLSISIIIKRKHEFSEIFKKVKKTNLAQFNNFLMGHAVELTFILLTTLLWSVFMFRSFYVADNILNIGTSVFSDFGAHVATIRSFSMGSNIPTEYPHFGNSTAYSLTGNNIRYHFMFQFLSGNLEYLGLRIDWAFNLPSILAMVSFLMLLYSFTVILLGRRLAAILTAILFFLRSSFAFFTYAAGLNPDNNLPSNNFILKYTLMFKHLITNILENTSSIGNTRHDDWGFYAQKVYVNKRHYAFALGISILVLIILYPLFKKMIVALKNTAKRALEAIKERASQTNSTGDSGPAGTKQSHLKIHLKIWVREFFLTKDAWLPKDLKRAIIPGILLGLIGFWNGAVAIATLPVLFLMALFSKHRLEYLYTAVITILLVLLQVNFFTTGNSADKMTLYIGYLASFPDDINKVATHALLNHDYTTFLSNIPQVSYHILLFYMELLGFLPLLLLVNLPISPKGLRWMSLAFLSPLLVATLMQFTTEVDANHVIVIHSVILMNIILASLVRKLFVSRDIFFAIIIFLLSEIYFYISAKAFKFDSLFLASNIFAAALILIVLIVNLLIHHFDFRRFVSMSVGLVLFTALISSGVVDAISLYNMDKKSANAYKMDDPLVTWIHKNTDTKDIFLINPDYTHRVLVAGRKVFNGGPYFVSGSGYDFNGRMDIVRRIYGAYNKEQLKNLVAENNIDYIVIDYWTRQSQEYSLNEQLLKDTFKLSFIDPSSDAAVYSTH